MSNILDESAFLGSALDSPVIAPPDEKVSEAIKAKKQTRRSTLAAIRAAVDTLLPIIENQLAKETDLRVVRDRATKRVKVGQSPRDALADELLFTEGRIDAFEHIERLLKNARGHGGDSDE